MAETVIDEAITLSAQHVAGGSVVDDDGVLAFRISDEEQAVELSHEIGDDEAAAQALHRLADAIHAHAERIQYRRRQRTAGWT